VRAPAPTHEVLRSGELARLAGVSPDTLRYYERRGLLPAVARSSAGYRLFPRESLARVRLIRSALSLGFSVSELSHIFRERNAGGTPCHRVRKLAEEKLVALDARLRELHSCRRELRATLAEWDRMLARTPDGKQARLLETFSATHPKSATRRYPLEVMNRGNRRQEKQ
jgi:DNA-binding transcriptional MerR regulator